MEIKTYEIFSETDSQIVQAKNMAYAISKYSLISGNINNELVAIIEIERGVEFLKQFSSVLQANELLPHVINWVAIASNVQPEKETEVLVVFKNKNVRCRFFGVDGRFYNNEFNLDVTDNITHWAKIPEPPCL